MKKWTFVLMWMVLLFGTALYLYQSEGVVQAQIKITSGSVATGFDRALDKLKDLNLDLRWFFPFLLLVFLVIEFWPSQHYKKSPGLPKILLAIFLLGVGFTIALILFIYNLPADKVRMAGIVIDRGPRDTFLSTIIHYTIVIGNGHFFALLSVAIWLEMSAKKNGETEE